MGGPGGVSAYNAKMICGACAQATHIRAHILVCVAALTLIRSSKSIAGRGSVLEVNTGAQSVGINSPVQCS